MKMNLKKKPVLLEISNAFERANRKRNIILIVTYVFSITGLFLLLSIISGRVKADELKRYRENGNLASVILENVSEEQCQRLTELNYVDEIGLIRNFGSWYWNDRKIAVCGMVSEETFQKMYLPALDNVKGNYPKNANEIIVSVRILNYLGIENPEIGMDIPVNIVPYNWIQNNAEEINMTFQLSGYYTDYIEEMGKLPVVFFSGELMEYQDICSFTDNALIKSNKLWMSSIQIENQFYSDMVLADEQNFFVINEGSLQTIRSMAGSCSFVLLGMILILISVNLFVYNIFSISVSKDRRQYGLLKVVGAEPRQIRWLFLFQELKIIVSGCALGILTGSLTVKIVLPKLLEKMYLAGNGSISGTNLYSWKLLFASILLSGIGAVIAFDGGIHTIIKLSPIECSKYGEKITISFPKHKSIKGMGIIGIAWRNFTRNWEKALITVVSLFVGIEVFLLAVVISNGLDQTHRIEQEPDFEIGITKETVEYYIRLNEGNALENLTGHQLVSEKIISEIKKINGVNQDSINKCIGGFGTFNHQSEAIKPRIASWQYDTEIITELTVQVVSDAWIYELEKYVEKKSYHTDIDTFKEGNGFILLHNHELSKQQSEAAEIAIGQSLSGILFEEDANMFESVCCGYLDFSKSGFPKLNMPWEGKDLNYIIISNKTMDTLEMKPVIYNVTFDVNEKDEQAVKNQIQGILRDANQKAEFNNTYYVTAASDMLAGEQSYISAIRITMGGFSGILMLFAFVSYYNTLLSGFATRKKEFTIMRNIGMTVKQLKQMLIYEGVFYCIFTEGLVLTLGNAMMGIVGVLLHNRISYFTFRYPVFYFIIALMGLVLVSVMLPLFINIFINGADNDYIR